MSYKSIENNVMENTWSHVVSPIIYIYLVTRNMNMDALSKYMSIKINN